ncbi:MAG: hypothetical protein ACE5D4_08865 [Thermodesulfobacteriota bacterium]
MDKFNDLIKKASQFVEKQKGVWDHSSWLTFLSDAEKVGGTMNEEMERYLGAVTESMKRFYEHSAERGKKITGNVSDQAAKFVDKSKGRWEHLEWEKFVKDIQQKGTDITENNKTYLGGILESAKKFYHSWPKGVEVEEETETAVTQEPELAEESPEQAVKVKPVRKPAAKKMTRAKSPKKEGAAPAKKPVKKTQPKKSASAAKSKSVRSATKAAPKTTASKGKASTTSAKPSTVKTKTAKSTSPKKVAAKKSTAKKPAVKKAVKSAAKSVAKSVAKSKAAPATKKK